MTRSAVSSLTSPRVSALSARETVPGCTRAARATSRSVTEEERTPAIMQTFAVAVGRGAPAYDSAAGPPPRHYADVCSGGGTEVAGLRLGGRSPPPPRCDPAAQPGSPARERSSGRLSGHDLLVAAELPDRLVDLDGRVGDGRRRAPWGAIVRREGLAGVGDLVELVALGRAQRVVGGQDHPQRASRHLVMLLGGEVGHWPGGPLLVGSVDTLSGATLWAPARARQTPRVRNRLRVRSARPVADARAVVGASICYTDA